MEQLDTALAKIRKRCGLFHTSVHPSFVVILQLGTWGHACELFMMESSSFCHLVSLLQFCRSSDNNTGQLGGGGVGWEVCLDRVEPIR